MFCRLHFIRYIYLLKNIMFSFIWFFSLLHAFYIIIVGCVTLAISLYMLTLYLIQQSFRAPRLDNFRPVVLNLFWPIFLKKYRMDNFAMLTPHEQPVETVLPGLSMGMPLLWESHGKRPVGRAGLGGQRGQLPQAPAGRGPPWWNLFVSNIILLWKIPWFRSDTRIQLYIIFLCCVKYQGPPTGIDFSTSLTFCQI